MASRQSIDVAFTAVQLSCPLTPRQPDRRFLRQLLDLGLAAASARGCS
jgi:hypothetical protein